MKEKITLSLEWNEEIWWRKVKFEISELNGVFINRGLIKGIDLTKDEQAIEIWLSIDEEAFVYYFFPYDNAVIEI